MKEVKKEKTRETGKKKKIIKIVGIVIIVIVVLNMILIRVMMNRHKDLPGNAAEYDVENVQKQADNILTGKRVVFLGSSVTKGEAAEYVSFVEYMEKRDGLIPVKEAVSATTLTDKWSGLAFLGYGNGSSYVKRLKKLDKDMQVDCLVCQLSTNDASKNLPLGEISDAKEMDSFDLNTITGAMEYIIAYSRQTWDCPVVFYTGSYYESEPYEKMVERLYGLQKKWGIGIIDLYTDEEFNSIEKETYDLYMNDKIHPTKAGYLKWWTPKMEKELMHYLENI